MSKKTNIANIIRSVKDARYNCNGRRLVPLFKKDGSWSGDVMRGGYSASDRDRNGDVVYEELEGPAQDYALTCVIAAVERLNEMKLAFGRGTAFNSQITVSDII